MASVLRLTRLGNEAAVGGYICRQVYAVRQKCQVAVSRQLEHVKSERAGVTVGMAVLTVVMVVAIVNAVAADAEAYPVTIGVMMQPAYRARSGEQADKCDKY